MRDRTRFVTHKILPLCVLLLIIIVASGCQKKSATVYQGYVEGEFVLLASPLAGRLVDLGVKRGNLVQTGKLLFTLDQEPQQAELDAASQQVKRAESRLQDLLKGERPSELSALRARQDQARATFELSQREFARRERLRAKQAIAEEELERARTDLKRDKAALAELEAQLQTAQLGARSDARAAARAELATAQARQNQARWAIAQKSQTAPREALVFDTLFEPGEFVPAGAPVVSLLPPGNLKIRFFVPEPLVGSLKIGQPLTFTFDGHDGEIPAQISFISPQVEYTPPVIYSREARTKLVFLIEARPEAKNAARLHPGQPVDVHLGGAP